VLAGPGGGVVLDPVLMRNGHRIVGKRLAADATGRPRRPGLKRSRPGHWAFRELHDGDSVFARVRSATDHEAFQRVVKHYPSCTYEEWQLPRSQEDGRLEEPPACVKMVDISPPSFTAYCERTGAHPDLTTFLKVLSDKASF